MCGMEKHTPVISKNQSLEQLISNSKDFAVVSLWWLSIPLFIVLMLFMKGAYIPGSAFVNDFHDFALREKSKSLIFFLISPLVIILINSFMIIKIRTLTGNPKSLSFLALAWPNFLIMMLCLTVLFIYSL